MRLPTVQLRLTGDVSRTLTVNGLIGQFSSLTSATGVKPVTVLLTVALVGLLLVALVAGLAPDPERRRRVSPHLVMGALGGAVGLLSMLLIPVVNAADHVDSLDGTPPLQIDGGGVITLLFTAVIAIGSAWHHQQVRS